MKALFMALTLSALGVASVSAGVVTNQDTEGSHNCELAFAHLVNSGPDGNVVFPYDHGQCYYYYEEEEELEAQAHSPRDADGDS